MGYPIEGSPEEIINNDNFKKLRLQLLDNPSQKLYEVF